MAKLRQAAVVGAIFLIACERDAPPTAPPEASPPEVSAPAKTDESPPPPASPVDPFSRSHLRAKSGAQLFDEPGSHAALFIDEVGLSYRILERQPHWLKVATVPWNAEVSDSRICMNRFRKSHEELELHVWVHVQDVASVLAEPVSQQYGDGTTVTLAAGVRLEHELPGEPWVAWLSHTRLPVPGLPDRAIARSFDPSPSQKLSETAYPVIEGEPLRYANGIATAEGRYGWRFSLGSKQEIVAHAIRPVEGEVLAELRTYCGSVTVRVPEDRVGEPVPRGKHRWPSYPEPQYGKKPDVPAGVHLSWLDGRFAGKTTVPLHVDDLGSQGDNRQCFRLRGVNGQLCYAPAAKPTATPGV